MYDLLKSYFAIGLDVEAAMSPTWSPVLVGVSFFIAMLAGLVFISLAGRLAEGLADTNRMIWTAVGAIIMGVGIWAMHFVGMVAYRLPIPVIYEPVMTTLSVMPAIAASAISLHLVARPEVSYKRLFAGGVIFGGGIADPRQAQGFTIQRHCHLVLRRQMRHLNLQLSPLQLSSSCHCVIADDYVKGRSVAAQGAQ